MHPRVSDYGPAQMGLHVPSSRHELGDGDAQQLMGVLGVGRGRADHLLELYTTIIVKKGRSTN